MAGVYGHRLVHSSEARLVGVGKGSTTREMRRCLMWINADVDSDEQDMAMDILKGRSATNIKAEMESDLAFVLLLGTETTFWMKNSADRMSHVLVWPPTLRCKRRGENFPYCFSSRSSTTGHCCPDSSAADRVVDGSVTSQKY